MFFSKNHLKNEQPINLLDLTRDQMKKFLVDINEKPFRANQIMKWIYHNFCDDFEKMTNISKSLRNKLKKFSEIKIPKIIKEEKSIDGTIKWLILISTQYIETVYIPEKNRGTLCVSSQIGCPVKCSFCATGQQKFYRNLLTSEIIGQIWLIKNIQNKKKILPITNIVFMGMGEPLLNVNNVGQAILIILDDYCFGFSKRRVTISTTGIVPAFKKLKKIVDVALAISLHASNDALRNKIVPINKKYNICNLLNAIKEYTKNSYANKKGITIEYVMLNNINDSEEDAHKLIILLKKIPSKINLIPWNFIKGLPYKTSSYEKIFRFSEILMKNGFFTVIRKTKGSDINASCGQLIGEKNS
ncbi:23S rRNA (adenine(2503)-C(2))-methyltransferase RlmN [Candidatus Tachikawaea gelatinosa]|uniref:Dual-specificity RNA methyltransferase RlmN n=1 Tax=Candidatus Tachikawaea gelatinosa TaxID=1410383 RepID=A0A090AJ31_9ENTR|nr:23S rRNA (adenine(2503)-C(2))-methyltransferase RlmN [Candidatus Tachikawaea gelatinosa]BAP58443.1 dual-specificity RNA methyltransferase RlmN [Candidatus Tachikawaea gelatinosa]